MDLSDESGRMIIPTDRVRDLTSAPRHIPIEIEGNVTFEVGMTIWSVLNPKSNSALDLGQDWHDKVTELTSEELGTELADLGGPYAFAWLGLASLMLSAPHPHDPTRVYDWLGGIDEERLRRWIVGYASDNADSSLIEEVVGGDAEAITRLLGDKPEKAAMNEFITWLVRTEGLPSRYASALQRFRAEVFAEFEPEFGAAISRAAAARRAAPTRGDAKTVVEEVTVGLDFEIPIGVTRVVLIPSMVTRPLSLINGHRETLIVYYGVADEFVDADPEAPPSWLVRIYKALSDDKRLRIMRRLSEGSASLDELSEMLGLTKSTVHHHINQLRGAGLIRVHVPADKTKSRHSYSMREQSLADAAGFLDSYLGTSPERQHA